VVEPEVRSDMVMEVLVATWAGPLSGAPRGNLASVWPEEKLAMLCLWLLIRAFEKLASGKA
jgi:hypothetical protein